MFISSDTKTDRNLDDMGFIIKRYMLNIKLTKSELLVLGIITSFTKSSGGFFGTRKRLAKYLVLSQKAVYGAISSLLERGLIKETNRNGLVGLASTDEILTAKRKRAPEY